MIDFRYRADVDGLRAVAVMLVLLFHAGLGFSGGYVGVDLFFVISGFLITGLILKEQQSDEFRLTNFWARRIRRVIPASTVMAVAVLIVGGFLLLPKDYEGRAKSTISQQLMLSNVYFWRNTDYFDGLFDGKPLLHTWSLAVEEQFYLVYPFLLVFLRHFSKRFSVAVLLGITAISLAVSQWGIDRYPVATYYLLPTRAWELLLGGLICFAPAPTRLKDWHLGLLSWLAIGGILIAGSLFDYSTPCPGLAALLPCGAAAILIYVNSVRLTWVGQVLSAKPVVFVGMISYSLYLWHWPILVYFRYLQGQKIGVLLVVIVLAASFGVAYLSWRFIETPFRKAARETSTFWPYVAAFTSAALVIGLSLSIQWSHGVKARFPEKALAVVDGIEVPIDYQTSLEEVRRGELPRLGVGDSSSPEIDFIVWGDSHAMAIAPLVNQLATKQKLSGVIAAQAGTVPLLDVWRPAECNRGQSKRIWNQDVFQYVYEHRIRNVVLASRWGVNINGRPNGMMDSLIIDDESKEASPPESRDAFVRALNKTISALEQRGLRVWILGQVPLQYDNPPKKLFYAAWWGGELPKGVSIQQHLSRQSNVVKSLARLQTHHTFLDPAPYCFDESGYSRIGDGIKSFYSDDDHLSPYGAQVLLKEFLDPVFAQMAAEKVRPHSAVNHQSADNGLISRLR